MQSDHNQPSPDATPDEATPATPTRADAYRERFRRAQAVAAQVARARAAGGQPSETEAARLVAEFHARGGRITLCPQADDVPPTGQNRAHPSGRPRP